GEVNVQPADELAVGADVAGQHLHLFELFVDQRVDPVVFVGLLPLEAAAVAHDDERGGRIRTFVAGHYGRLAAADGGHGAGSIDRRRLGVARIEERLGGDVARLAVGERGDDGQLLLLPRQADDGAAGNEFDRLDARPIQVGLDAVADPRLEDLVIWLARLR